MALRTPALLLELNRTIAVTGIMATYTFRTSHLPKLDLDTDKGTDFLAWHQQWIAYCSLSGLSKESATKQVQALQLCFSRETLNIVDNLGLTAAQKKDQTEIIAALKHHIEGRINETIERRNFRQRAQHVGESFDDFLVSPPRARKDMQLLRQ